MANYYNSNAIYDRLICTEHNFYWLVGNSWLLIYGNKKPLGAKLFVLVLGGSRVRDKDLNECMREVVKSLKLPFFVVKFNDSEGESIDNISLFTKSTKEGEKISLNELKKRFKDVGLHIKSGGCNKYLNDQTSSAYHSWQRSELGSDIIVTDIDLIRVNNNKSKKPIEFIELKRSYIEVGGWTPYRDDYPNFNLILDAIKGSDIKFTIAYNKRATNPFYDDASIMSIFSYKATNSPTFLKQVSFQEFVNRDY
jgi:hypothetical protein